MCYGDLDPKYLMREMEDRLGARSVRGLAAEAAPARAGIWGHLARLAARLLRRPDPLAERRVG